MSEPRGEVRRRADGRIIGGHWREPKPYWDAAWLRRQYEVMGRTPEEIGADFGVGGNSIRSWVHRHGIRRRSLSETRALKFWSGRRRGDTPREPRENPALREIPDIVVIGEIAIVELTRGAHAVIDASDAELVAGRLWRLIGQSPRQYAAAIFTAADGSKQSKTMHRVILDPPDDLLADHVDGDGLNNRRSNLRLATSEQNAWNSARPSTNKSGFKGVCWSKAAGRWRATIKKGGKQTHLGLFDDPAIAHEAYKAAALRLHGEFARFE